MLQKVDHICREAAKLFARYGFEGVTMRHVAEASGVTMATLYYHFKSKEELHDEVTQLNFEHFIGGVLVQWNGCPPPQQRPSTMMALIFDAVWADPTLFLLMQHDLHNFDEGDRRSRSRKRYLQFLSLLRTAIQRYRSAEADETEVFVLAALITGYCELIQADQRTSAPGAEDFVQRHRATMILHVQRSFEERP